MRRNSWLFFAVLGIGLFVWFNGRVRGFCAEVTHPFRRVAQSVGREASVRLGAAWQGLRDGPVRLDAQAEVERLQVMLAAQSRLAVENEALRAALGWQKQAGVQAVAAPVSSHGGGLGVWPRLVLGMGSAQGIAAGDAVVAPEGLVGRVAEGVSAHRCEVILLSDPSCRVAAEVPGVLKGVVQGTEGRDFGEGPEENLLYVSNPLLMRFVAKEAEPPLRAQLYTEGSGGLFPRGVLIGEVAAVRREEAGLLNEVLVEPAVNPALLQIVFVLTATPGPGEPVERAQNGE